MTQIYLIRHGETEWNKNGLCMGQLDIPLNTTGIMQAERLAQRLAKIKIDALYTSDLARAAQTAAIIASKHQIKPIVTEELREIFLGPYQSLSTEEVRARFPGAYLIPQGAMAQQSAFREPEIENRTKLYARAIKIFDQIAARHPQEEIVIVTHGGVMRCLLSYLLGKDSNHNDGIFYTTAVDCSNCSITLIRREADGALKLVTINDTSHLEDLFNEAVDKKDYG